MFIRITRLLLIIIISIFVGMCIVWWVEYVATERRTLMLNIAMLGSLILLATILAVQFFENRKRKKDEEKIIKEQEKLDKNKV